MGLFYESPSATPHKKIPNGLTEEKVDDICYQLQ
jgi:hypothetical protein